MTRIVLESTAQVAHVWAQGTQETGRNSASRVFFEGPTLYSYGRHFVTGFRCPDGGPVFLNADSYSVSTSRHQSDARGAVRHMDSHIVPGLTKIQPDLDAIARRPVWIDTDGAEYASPWGPEGQRLSASLSHRPATAEEARDKLPALARHFVAEEGLAPLESMVAVFRFAGAKPKEAAAIAAKTYAAQIARRESEALARAKATRDGLARDAKAWAARPLSDTLAELKAREKPRYGRFQAERQAAEVLAAATRIFRAAKEAKARGWTRVAALCKIHEKARRAWATLCPAIEARANRLAWVSEKAREVKTALRVLGGEAIKPASNGRDWAAYDWRQAAKAAESLIANLGPNQEGPGFMQSRARIMGADLPAMMQGLRALAAAFEEQAARADIVQSRAENRKAVSALKLWKAKGATATAEEAEAVASAARRFARVPGYQPSHGGAVVGGYQPKIPAAFTLAGFTGESFLVIKEAATARATAAKREEKRAAFEAWQNGAGPLPSAYQNDGNGGALLRAVAIERDDSGAIIGGRLDTSQGASVPLAHALKAFRFLKLCRDNGRAWAANGKTLAVGHFRIDRIDASGNFRAGCHKINWTQVAALAARLGVADLAPADTTESRA